MKHFLVTFKHDSFPETALKGLYFYEINGIIKRYMVEIPFSKKEMVDSLKENPSVWSIHPFAEGIKKADRQFKRKKQS